MNAPKLDIQKRLDVLYEQLEVANIAYSKHPSAENETRINALNSDIDELINQLIKLDDPSA
jgi:cupin superfamily acireductone dioxygenase involved in methionine salvage